MVDVLSNIIAIKQEGNYGSYEIGPVPSGYSVSLANALRRVLISSLPGAAITSVLIEGVQHEFQDITHVKEDVTDIVQQLKQIRLRSYASRDVRIHLDVQGEGRITAGDIRIPGTIEIVNPELHVATLDNDKAHLVMEMVVGTGRGFLSAQAQAERRTEGLPIGVILTDAIFSPVRHVNFTIESVHVGREKHDYILLGITTDGTISPSNALRESADILVQQFRVFANYQPGVDEPPTEQETILSTVPIPPEIYNRSINELDLSTRSFNSFKRHGIAKVGEILEMNEKGLKSFRNVGDGTLKDICECLFSKGFLP